MSQLLQFGDYWVDPNKVISVAPVGGPNLRDEFFINVDMGSYVANYAFENDLDGWTVDGAAEVINAERT